MPIISAIVYGYCGIVLASHLTIAREPLQLQIGGEGSEYFICICQRQKK